jgi:ATP-dependent Lon protease
MAALLLHKAIAVYDDLKVTVDGLLCGGIWCIVQLEYEFIEEDKK